MDTIHFTTFEVSKNCRMSDKQCRPWSDAAISGVWSGSTVFAQACLSKLLGKENAQQLTNSNFRCNVYSDPVQIVKTGTLLSQEHTCFKKIIHFSTNRYYWCNKFEILRVISCGDKFIPFPGPSRPNNSPTRLQSLPSYWRQCLSKTKWFR